MEAQTYRTVKGVTQFRPVLESMDEMDSNMGFCLGCGAEAYGVEPDARQYRCEGCGASKVYGLEELALMGLLKVPEDLD